MPCLSYEGMILFSCMVVGHGRCTYPDLTGGASEEGNGKEEQRDKKKLSEFRHSHLAGEKALCQHFKSSLHWTPTSQLSAFVIIRAEKVCMVYALAIDF